MTIQDFEHELVKALKEHNTTEVSTFRLLISRLKNEQIASGAELSDEASLKIVQSEYKKRKEAEGEYLRGGRGELASKEGEEANVLARFLPKQLTTEEATSVIERAVVDHAWTKADFGVAMKSLKEQLGATVDGALLAKILKEKLK